jgi:beta-glucosidase
MNFRHLLYSTFSILLFVGSALSFAQDSATEESFVRAIEPAIQTASYAVEWWMPRHNAIVERAKQGDVDLLMIGDSITHGWESTGKELWAKYYAHRKAINMGFGGDRTEHVLWRLQNGEVDGLSPKLAVIMIGTNNTGHHQDPAQDTARGIRLILKELQTRLPNMKILLLAVFPRGAERNDPLRILNTEINELISAYGQSESIHFLTLNKLFLEEDGTLPTSIMPELLHPNERAYRMWAEAMEPTIQELLGEK